MKPLMKNVLIDARRHQYALSAFNFENIDMLLGIIEGAAACRSPVIVQTTLPALDYIGVRLVVAAVREMEHVFNTPVFLHLDHCGNMERIRQCIEAGFDSVMIDLADESYEINRRETIRIIELAHKSHVLVEGEIGVVGSDDQMGKDTCPMICERYVTETKVDTLAIAIGSVHGRIDKNTHLDIDLLQEIQARVSVPLVLHGSSGVVDDDIVSAISYGISKVNIETELRSSFFNEIRSHLVNDPSNIKPRVLMGFVRKAISALVQNKCMLFGSANRR